MSAPEKSLWELLWDYDPNGLVALDDSMRIQVVNPAFCRMFRAEAEEILGQPAGPLLGELDDFEEVLESGEPIIGRERRYPERDLNLRQVIFAVKDRRMVACICVDLSPDERWQFERSRLKQETIEKVHEVVDNQMKVAQEIASLLGETTAATKSSLLKLLRALEVQS